MTDLLPISGEMNGYKFSVVAEPPEDPDIQEDLAQKLEEWFRENNQEYLEFIEKYEKEIQNEDFDKIPSDIPRLKEWVEDKEFRAEIFKKTALTCMQFEEPVPEDLWSSDELDYECILESWKIYADHISEQED